MTRAVFLLALGQILLSAESLILQPAQYTVRQWGPADGLPEEQIFGIAQTQDGFLWLASAYGLVRFSGDKFTVFHPKDGELATSTVVVAARAEGPSDLTVWARDGSSYRFRQGRYERLVPGETPPFPISRYLQVAKKEIWVPADITSKAPTEPSVVAGLLDGEKITARADGAAGGKWFGSNKGRIIEFADGSYHSVTPLGLSRHDIVVRLRVIGQKLAVGTTAGYFERENGKWRRFSSEAVTSINVDSEGRMWVGTAVGLAVCDQGRWMRFRESNGLPEASVFATFADTEGNIWASFERTGLFRIRSPRFPSFGELEGIVTDRPLALLDATSGLWIAGDRAVDHIAAEARFRIPLPPANRRVRSMIEDAKKAVWISTSDDILRIDPTTHKVTRITTDPSLGYHHSLFEARDREIWLIHAQGLSQFKDGRFVPVPVRNLPLPLPLRVYLAQTDDGTMWLGARERGLYRITRGEAIPVHEKDPVTRKIHLLYADGGDLWMGLDGEGLARLRDGQIRVYPVLPDGEGRVYGLAEDHSGQFWLGLRSQLIALRKEDVHRYLDGQSASVPQREFDTTDGMRSANFGLSYTPVTGRRSPVLWMATLQGVLRIDSARIHPNPLPPVVTLSHFAADNDTPLVAENGILRVPANVETFRILAEAPSLTAASKVRFRRKLEGYDSDWVPFTGGINTYTKLPPGEYTLRVTASNSDGVWSETGASLRVIKLPAFYQTWWFFGLMACAAAASIWLAIRWRTRLLRSRNEELEEHVHQRTAELEKSKFAAEAAAQAKADFLATMSHEIRTPMHGVLGTLELLSSTILSTEQREYVTTISQSSNTLLALLNDVLDLSKLEAGRMELRNAPFAVKTIAAQVARPFESAARLKNVGFEVVIDPALPLYFMGDKPRIRQILFNLVGNAVKFTDSGKVQLRIEGQPAGKNLWSVSFLVVDTGIGIPEQHFASMFNKFHQVDGSLSRKHGGTGLGLAICRRLADLMHGSLSFESLENAGSTFRLTLTLEETSRMPTVETAIDFGGIPTRFGGRVLLVEDNPVNRRLALSLLEKLGCRVDTAVNGLEAVAKADASSYHLILMDCHMPEMDGLEATREIRSRSTDRPAPVIVAMTANAMEGDRERCVAAGMNDYLAKPFHLRDLIELLDRYLKAVPADTSDTLETVPNIDSVNRAC